MVNLSILNLAPLLGTLITIILGVGFRLVFLVVLILSFFSWVLGAFISIPKSTKFIDFGTLIPKDFLGWNTRTVRTTYKYRSTPLGRRMTLLGHNCRMTLL